MGTIPSECFGPRQLYWPDPLIPQSCLRLEQSPGEPPPVPALTPRPQPWFRDRMGGTGWLAPQQGPPSLTVGWGWQGVKPVSKRNPQVPLPTLLPLSLSPPLSLPSRGSTHRRPRRQRRRSRVLTAASQMATRIASARHADRPAGEWTRPRHPLVLSFILLLPGGLRSLAFQAPLTHRMEDPTCPRPPTPPPAHPAVVVGGTRLPVGGGGGVGLRGQPPDTHSAARPSGRCAGSPGRAERGR